MTAFRPVDPRELGACFEAFRSAFRLELLPEYRVPEEAEIFAAFRRGEQQPDRLPPAYDPWLAMIRERTTAGSVMQRVHLVPDPPSDYVRFEITWGYPIMNAAGEDIRLLRARESRFSLESLPVAKDFWLFDDERCFLMDYDVLGRFISPVAVAAEEIGPYVAAKRELLAEAKPLTTYSLEG